MGISEIHLIAALMDSAFSWRNDRFMIDDLLSFS